jgi:hypothetical protein
MWIHIPVGKKPLGRPRHRWKDVREIRWDWMHLAEDRGQRQAIVDTVMNHRVP